MLEDIDNFVMQAYWSCINRHTCSIKNTLKTHRDPTLIFGILIVLYMKNKNIEKNFLSGVGVWGSCEIKVTRSCQKVTFLFT